jgi:hypothetical protein
MERVKLTTRLNHGTSGVTSGVRRGLTGEQQARQDQPDLWHTLNDPKGRAEVVERIRKRKDEKARRTPPPPPVVAPKIVVTPAPVKPRLL